MKTVYMVRIIDTEIHAVITKKEAMRLLKENKYLREEKSFLESDGIIYIEYTEQHEK
jgi:hypothetical protein